MTMPNTEARGARGEAAGQTPRGDSGNAREQLREVKDQVVGQAKTTLQQARDRASSSLVESKAQIAGQFGGMADALRRTTEHLRSEDQHRIAGMTESAARQLDQVATYLWNKDARAIRADLESLARRQPAIVLGGALVLGLIGARFLKSSQRDRRSRGSQTFGPERRVGNGSYDQPSEGTETHRHMPVTGRGHQGGGYAGA
jgi:hypothetical protein